MNDIHDRIARQKRENERAYRTILHDLLTEDQQRTLADVTAQPVPMKKQCIMHRTIPKPRRRV